MALIDLEKLSSVATAIHYQGVRVATYYKWKNREPQIVLENITNVEVAQRILTKMKELQGEKV